MRTLLFILLALLFISEYSNAQIKQGSVYIIETTQPVALRDDIQASILSDPENLATVENSVEAGDQIKYLYETNGFIYYSYLGTPNDVKRLPIDEFHRLTNAVFKQFKGFKAGAYTLPFKLRDIGGEMFDFESSLSLNTNIIFGFGRIKKKNPFFEASFGLGITGANLIPDNTRDNVEQTAIAFTPSFGATFLPNSKINIGGFFGWDFLGLNDSQLGWHYNRKAWVGLGINVQFTEWEPVQVTK